MRTLEAATGAVLAVGGTIASVAGIGGGSISLGQIVVVVVTGAGGVGGVWLMTRAIFGRQESRIAQLEAQNAAQQQSLDAAHKDHGKCEIALARVEEKLAAVLAAMQERDAKRP